MSIQHEERPSVEEAGRGARVARRRTILVVEDDPDFRELLVDHLVSSGRTVRSVGDGAEALATLRSSDAAIGLVLLDLRMPVMDGFELCRRLEQAPSAAVPTVVMTAEHETRRIERYPWIKQILFKPLDLFRLDALIDAHLRA